MYDACMHWFYRAGVTRIRGSCRLAVALRNGHPRSDTAAGLTAAVVIGLLGSGAGVASAAEAGCALPVAPVYQVVNPTSQASLVTASKSEADNARANYGFTVDNGVILHAPAAAATGLNPVVRLYHPTSGDFLWTADAAEAVKAVTTYGYQRQKTDFYASPAQLSCTIPVTRLVKGSLHRLAVGSTVATLTAAGWNNEGVKFHAFPAPQATLPLSSVPAGGVLGDAIYTFSDFSISKDGRQVGAVLPAAGLSGQGATRSIVRMDAGSSTKASTVPADDPANVNPLDLLLVTGTAGTQVSPTLSGFTLQGTAQGHLYNGLRLSYTRGATISGVKVAAVPGNYHINPGETFGINDWQGHGNTYTDVEVDGAGVGASALGFNSSENVTVTRADLHDNPYSAGVAAWKTRNVTLTDVRTTGNRTGLNFERVTGTVVVTRPTIQGNTEQDLYIGTDGDSATYTITDPVLTAGAKLRIRLPANEMGSPNQQKKSDIKVLVNGTDVTASLVQWL